MAAGLAATAEPGGLGRGRVRHRRRLSHRDRHPRGARGPGRPRPGGGRRPARPATPCAAPRCVAPGQRRPGRAATWEQASRTWRPRSPAAWPRPPEPRSRAFKMLPRTDSSAGSGRTAAAAAVAFAGADAVRYALARTHAGRAAGRSTRDGTLGMIWESVLRGPVRARARGVGAAVGGRPGAGPRARPRRSGRGGSRTRPSSSCSSLMSWLPERAVSAARRRRPDVFARYLEGLAGPGSTAGRAARRCRSAAGPRRGTEPGPRPGCGWRPRPRPRSGRAWGCSAWPRRQRL